MKEQLVFDYYYGKEADQFSFYRIPRMLIKDAHFSSLSNDAKILYGLMLDRMSLSIRNGWQDEEDRTYIIYTIENIMDDLNCSKSKAIKTLSELDNKNGIGLIEKKRIGLGKPDIIYVMNFVGVKVSESVDETEQLNCDENHNQKYDEISGKIEEASKADFKKSEIKTSRVSKNELQEVSKKDFMKIKNETFRSSNNRKQEVSNLEANYNDIIQSKYNHTENNHSNHITSKNFEDNEAIVQDKMDEINEIYDYLKDCIDYDALISNNRNGVKCHNKPIIDELLDVMVQAMCSKRQYINIGGEDIPVQLVRSRFEKYNYTIMEYVIECIKNNTTKIKNVRKYMLAVLFNAPSTINMYYLSEVNHDMYRK